MLFLTAGDALAPEMLARIAQVLASDPGLEAVVCGWSIADEGERPESGERCAAEGDLFDLLARRRAFPSCACVVRRTVVDAAGGFDPSYGDAADWVLWQRIARRGARFGYVDQPLVMTGRRAVGRVAPRDELRQTLAVIALGHRADPAVPLPISAPYAAGRLARPDEAEVNALCAAAGIALATGGDVAPLLALLPAGRRVVDVDTAAAEMVGAFSLATAGLNTDLAARWPSLCAPLGAFAAKLELHIERPGLARAIAVAVQRLVLPRLRPPLPTAVEGTQLGVVDADGPIEDVRVPGGVEIVQLLVRLDGGVLGAIELPAVDGGVTSSAIRAAIASRWTERLLERFFASHGHERGVAELLWDRDPPFYARVADAIDRVAASLRQQDDGRHQGPVRAMVLEVGRAVPHFVFGRRNVAVELRVAGLAVGSVEVIVGPLGVISGRALRAAAIAAAGPALVRAVVGELVIGAPLADGALTSPSESRRRRS